MHFARWATTLLFACVLLVGGFVRADDFTSTDYKVLSPVLQPAGYATSSDYQLWSTIGEPALGVSTGTSYEIRAGFLQFPFSAVPVPGSGGGGGGGGGGKGLDRPYIFPGPFVVLVPPLDTVPPICEIPSDMSCDGIVDIVDFSIMYYWFAKPNPPTRVDLNRDGRIDIYDFSIMAFYWTR